MDSDIIDRAALLRLMQVMGGDPADLAELLKDYQEDAPELSRNIVAAASAGDIKSLRIAAHTLKSNARDFGAVRLAECCADLERACSSGELTGALALAERIAEEEVIARDRLSKVDPGDLDRPALK